VVREVRGMWFPYIYVGYGGFPSTYVVLYHDIGVWKVVYVPSRFSFLWMMLGFFHSFQGVVSVLMSLL